MVSELKTNPSSLTVFDWPSRFKVAFQKRHTHMDISTQLIKYKECLSVSGVDTNSST